MSDYVSIRSIKLKNELMMPKVLQAYRDGELTLQDLQTETSPLKELYKKSYDYLFFPDLSEDDRNLIRLVQPINISPL